MSRLLSRLLSLVGLQRIPPADAPLLAVAAPPVAIAPPAAPSPAPPACAWCKEVLEEDNRHPMMRACHIECAVRMTSGSMAHLKRECGCFVKGSTDNDPPNLTLREAALEVYRHMRERMHGPAN